MRFETAEVVMILGNYVLCVLLCVCVAGCAEKIQVEVDAIDGVVVPFEKGGAGSVYATSKYGMRDEVYENFGVKVSLKTDLSDADLKDFLRRYSAVGKPLVPYADVYCDSEEISLPVYIESERSNRMNEFPDSDSVDYDLFFYIGGTGSDSTRGVSRLRSIVNDVKVGGIGYPMLANYGDKKVVCELWDFSGFADPVVSYRFSLDMGKVYEIYSAALADSFSRAY